MRKGHPTMKTSHVLRTLLATGALAALSTPALAVDSTWDAGGVGDNWFTDMNWDNDTVPNDISDTAVINDLSPVFANGNITLAELTVLAGGELSTGISLSLDVTGASAASMLTNAGTINLGNNSDLGIVGSVNNSGTINITSTGNQTDLEVGVGGATLTGGGEIVFSGAFAGINDVSATQTLTISDQTLRGVGQLGRNTMDFINEGSGLIDADDVGGGILRIDAANSFANAGTLRASNGGRLEILNTPTVDNTGGVIEALANSVVSLEGIDTLTAGTVRSVDNGDMRTGISTNVTFFDTTFEGTVTAGNNSDFGIGGTINNTGTIALASTGNATDLEIQVGGATLTGGGEVVLSGAFARINDANGTQTLTIADHTIRGVGSIGQNTMNVVNSANGLIDADSAAGTGILVIDPLGTLQNQGTMRASNGGTLRLDAGIYNNAGGVIEALDSSTVSFTNGTINDGIVRSVGTGGVETTISSNVTFFDTSFGGSVTAGNNSDFGIGGTIDNAGTINIASTGNQTDLEVQAGGATLTGGGEIVFSGAFAGLNDTGGSQTLTIEDQTLRGRGQLGRNTTNIINQLGNLINADDAGGILVLDPVSTFTNAGTLRASNGGELQLNAGDFENAGGVIEALEGSTVLATNGTVITGGTVRSVGTGQVLTAISSNVTFFDTTFGGSFTAGNNSDFGIGGTINNEGTINIISTGNQTDLEVQLGGATLTGGGEIVLSGPFAGINAVSGAPTLTVTDQTILTATNASGTISVDTTNSGQLIAGDNSTLTLSRSFTNTATGIIGGTGEIVATAFGIDNDGTIGPGQSIGELVIVGEIRNSDTSVTSIEIAGSGPGEADLLIVDGLFDVDGILEITFLDGAETLVAGDSITIIDSAQLIGQPAFDSIVVNSAGTFDVIYDDGPSAIILTNFSGVVPIPEPSSLALLGLGGLLLARRRRG